MLKKYNEFLNEEANPETVDLTAIGAIFNKMKDAAKKKNEENKKLITEYYWKTTKDGQVINTEDIYYTYGKYIGNNPAAISKKEMNLIFQIKFNEPSSSGLSFIVIKCDELPDIKIEADEILITSKGKKSMININPGYISGKFVVKSLDKIDLLKVNVPEEVKAEEPKEKTDKSKRILEEVPVRDSDTISRDAINLRKYLKAVGQQWNTSEHIENFKNIYIKSKNGINNIDKQIAKLDEIKEKTSDIKYQYSVLTKDKELLEGVIKSIQDITGKEDITK
jgi:hypothetical protein